jgi:hypothetical protein
MAIYPSVDESFATASYRPLIDASLEAVRVGPDTVVAEGKSGLPGKPEPDLLLATRERLGTRTEDCMCELGSQRSQTSGHD